MNSKQFIGLFLWSRRVEEKEKASVKPSKSSKATTLFLFAFLLIFSIWTSAVNAETTGEKASITYYNKNDYQFSSGDTINYYVKVKNTGDIDLRVDVAIEIHNPSNKLVFDSHQNGEIHDLYLKPNEEKRTNFTWTILSGAPNGTYKIIIGVHDYVGKYVSYNKDYDFVGLPGYPPADDFIVKSKQCPVSCGSNAYCSAGSCYCNAGYTKCSDGTCKETCEASNPFVTFPTTANQSQRTELRVVVDLTKTSMTEGCPVQWYVTKPSGEEITGEKDTMKCCYAGGLYDEAFYDFPNEGTYKIKVDFLSAPNCKATSAQWNVDVKPSNSNISECENEEGDNNQTNNIVKLNDGTQLAMSINGGEKIIGREFIPYNFTVEWIGNSSSSPPWYGFDFSSLVITCKYCNFDSKFKILRKSKESEWEDVSVISQEEYYTRWKLFENIRGLQIPVKIIEGMSKFLEKEDKERLERIQRNLPPFAVENNYNIFEHSIRPTGVVGSNYRGIKWKVPISFNTGDTLNAFIISGVTMTKEPFIDEKINTITLNIKAKQCPVCFSMLDTLNTTLQKYLDDQATMTEVLTTLNSYMECDKS